MSEDRTASRPTMAQRIATFGRTVLACVVVLLLLEGGLRLLAFDAVEPPNTDPTRMPREVDRAYVQEGEFLVRRPEASMLHPGRFAADKPADVYRVFVVGGSSVFGIGVAQEDSLPNQIKAHLQPVVTGKRVEVINAGWVAADSERLKVLIAEVVHYSPDLVVAYTGQNEHFIHYDPEGKGPAGRTPFAEFVNEVRIFRALDALFGLERLEQSRWDWGPLTTVAYEDVASFYATNIRDMAESCRAQGIPLVFSSITANVKSAPRQSPTLSDVDQAALAKGLSLETAGQFSAAIGAYSEALATRPDLAEAHYRRAGCYEALGNEAEAGKDYIAAMARDRRLNRAHADITEATQVMAAESEVHFVDLVAHMHAAPGSGFFLEDLFFDQCHASRRTYELLAQRVAAVVAGQEDEARARLVAVRAALNRREQVPTTELNSWGQHDAQPAAAGYSVRTYSILGTTVRILVGPRQSVQAVHLETEPYFDESVVAAARTAPLDALTTLLGAPTQDILGTDIECRTWRRAKDTLRLCFRGDERLGQLRVLDGEVKPDGLPLLFKLGRRDVIEALLPEIVQTHRFVLPDGRAGLLFASPEAHLDSALGVVLFADGRVERAFFHHLSYRYYVPHSVVPGWARLTSVDPLLALLGYPDRRVKQPDGGEHWFYVTGSMLYRFHIRGRRIVDKRFRLHPVVTDDTEWKTDGEVLKNMPFTQRDPNQKRSEPAPPFPGTGLSLRQVFDAPFTWPAADGR